MSRYDPTGTLSGAEYLASIYGTEKDKVNCSFYFKIGACRHGDKCSRAHHKPAFSNTVLLKNFYHSPVVDVRQADAFDKVGKPNTEEQTFFDEFYEEIFVEMEDAYGPVEELNVCENIVEHMVDNVYVKFLRLKDAEGAVQALENRWFNGEPVYSELSPVTVFRESRCRQHEISTCAKGGFCNFVHLKNVSDQVYDKLDCRFNEGTEKAEAAAEEEMGPRLPRRSGPRRSRWMALLRVEMAGVLYQRYNPL